MYVSSDLGRQRNPRKADLQTHTIPILYRFLPIMVSRLILSLKKVAGPISVAEWRVDHFSRVEITDMYGSNLRMVPVRHPPVASGSGVPSTSQV